ncbi:MAG: nitrilase-related carbon-nitrogen hydrolase [Armatimonadota bacterium]|nr:nitrilase-related carbon-nitrogen hydrolase [Armatimonadota bacterium]
MEVKGVLLARALRSLLWWRSAGWRIHRVLRRKRITRSRACDDLPSPRVRVAAVQMELKALRSAEEYAEKVYGLMVQAVQQGAHLVVFPEDSGTHLVGLLPGIADLPPDLPVEDALAQVGGPEIRVAEIFRTIGPAVRRIYETTFSFLARAFGVYVVTGSALLPDEQGNVRNIAYFYGPDGRIIGTHAKCHLIQLEARWGLVPGDDLRVYRTPVGNLAFPICMDRTYFETTRILRLLGADLILVPSADPDPFNFWKKWRGTWPRVQETQVYGVDAFMVGRFMGLTITGRSAVYAPIELTSDGTGVLSKARTFDQEEVVVGEIDYALLEEVRRAFPVEAGFNLELYKRYFPRVYHEYRARTGTHRRIFP